jgi:hypothetical protein
MASRLNLLTKNSALMALVFALLAGLSLPLTGGLTQAEAAEGRLGPATFAVHRTEIACFHGRVDRFTGMVQPRNCEIAGYEGRGRKFTRFPLAGIKWESWGRFNSPTSLLSSFFKRRRVYRVVAYRRVECHDHQVWYSRANVLDDRGDVHTLRLPVCDDPEIARR